MESNTYRFPVDLQKVFERYQLKVYSVPELGRRGMLTEDLKIIVNSSDKEQVQIYSQAHELIEILVAALWDFDPDYLTEEQIKDLNDRKEYWCETGAADILMPMNLFRSFIQDSEFSIQTAKSVSKSSGLSLFAVLRRMIESDLRKCVFVIWHYAHKPSDFTPNQLTLGENFAPPKELRVERAYKCTSLTPVIWNHKSIQIDTAIGKTFLDGGTAIVRGYDYVEICSIKGYFRTESIHVKYDGISRVWSIVFYDDEVDSQYVIN